MIRKSNFYKIKNKFKLLPFAVSISGKSPDWYTGREYKKLAPKYWFFKKYKIDGDEHHFLKMYYKEVLCKLDAKEVIKELGQNAILLCYENANEFCHRHIVGEWLKYETGIIIEEI